MSVALPLQDYRRRQTLVAHSFGKGLVVGAIIVNFVAELLYRDAVLAFLIRPVLSLALLLDLRQEVLKAFMLNLNLVLLNKAIRALLVWSMLALVLDIFH